MSKSKVLLRMVSQSRSGQYEAHGSITDVDCVIGQSFGYRKTPNGIVIPGMANVALASYAADNLSKTPKIFQFEIDDALEAITGYRAEYRIEKHRKEGKYLDTREVSAQAVDIMRQNGWNKAALLDHPYHMPRVDSVVQNFNVDTVVPEGIEAVWDEESAQVWTRSPEQWARREIVAIGVYAVKGWLTLE